MFIHFDLFCDRETQEKLYQELRHKIEEWKKIGLVQRAVMTFHFPNGSLYVCLDIPGVKESIKQHLSAEEIKQIPEPIIKSINFVSEENAVKLGITNYKIEIEQAKKGSEKNGKIYYDDAPVNEILRFASIGTKITFEVYQVLETDKEVWFSDKELSDFIFSRLKDELGSNYKWIDWALHFVCNPLLLREDAVLNPFSNRALKYIKNKL